MVHYAAGVVALWCVLAVAGLGYGIASLVSGGPVESRYLAFGFGVIGAFVASFAVRPIVVADRAGLSVLPVFGSRLAFRWDEIQAVGVRSARRARGRGDSLEILASEDREAKLDGLWLGLTPGALRSIDQHVMAFARSLDLTAPIGALADPVEDWSDDPR